MPAMSPIAAAAPIAVRAPVWAPIISIRVITSIIRIWPVDARRVIRNDRSFIVLIIPALNHGPAIDVPFPISIEVGGLGDRR